MRNKTLILLIATMALWLPLVAFTPAIPWFTPPKNGEDPIYDSTTWEKMKTLKVSLQWNNISLKSALDDLTAQSKQADPAHQGITFLSKPPSDTPKVSLILTDTSLDDVLGYLSAQTNLRVKIHRGVVVLLPLKDTAKLGQ